jgi:Redoxin
MRRLPMIFLGLFLAVSTLRAEDKPVPVPATLKDLQTEFAGSLAAEVPGDRAAVMKEYATRLLAFAERYPNTEDAFQALLIAIQVDNQGGSRALAVLTKSYADQARTGRILHLLRRRTDLESTALMEALVEKQKSPVGQAKACQALIDFCQRAVVQAKEFRERDDIRKDFERRMGKDSMEQLLKNADHFADLAKRYSHLYEEKYKDTLPVVKVGQLAPDANLTDTNGKKLKLSDLRGKVVVLTFWASWCPICNGMIPQERELVKRLKDKPFVLVSVSADARKEAFTAFLEKNEMP